MCQGLPKGEGSALGVGRKSVTMLSVAPTIQKRQAFQWQIPTTTSSTRISIMPCTMATEPIRLSTCSQMSLSFLARSIFIKRIMRMNFNLRWLDALFFQRITITDYNLHARSRIAGQNTLWQVSPQSPWAHHQVPPCCQPRQTWRRQNPSAPCSQVECAQCGPRLMRCVKSGGYPAPGYGTHEVEHEPTSEVRDGNDPSFDNESLLAGATAVDFPCASKPFPNPRPPFAHRDCEATSTHIHPRS